MSSRGPMHDLTSNFVFWLQLWSQLHVQLGHEGRRKYIHVERIQGNVFLNYFSVIRAQPCPGWQTYRDISGEGQSGNSRRQAGDIDRATGFARQASFRRDRPSEKGTGAVSVSVRLTKSGATLNDTENVGISTSSSRKFQPPWRRNRLAEGPAVDRPSRWWDAVRNGEGLELGLDKCGWSGWALPHERRMFHASALDETVTVNARSAPNGSHRKVKIRLRQGTCYQTFDPLLEARESRDNSEEVNLTEWKRDEGIFGASGSCGRLPAGFLLWDLMQITIQCTGLRCVKLQVIEALKLLEGEKSEECEKELSTWESNPAFARTRCD
ncbi:hypothetical protein C8R47DRAFT_1074679 [Mycena vitilis]|nr:hypothetical protein C8R47DRAFT_1074679 [Mycena vitilis]